LATYMVTKGDMVIEPGASVTRRRDNPSPVSFTFEGVGPVDRSGLMPKVLVRNAMGVSDHAAHVFGLNVVAVPGPCTNDMCVSEDCDDVTHTDGSGNRWEQPVRSAWCLGHDQYCLAHCTEPDDRAEVTERDSQGVLVFDEDIAERILFAVTQHLRAYTSPGGNPLPDDYMPKLFEPGLMGEHWVISWEGQEFNWPHAVAMGEEVGEDMPFAVDALRIPGVEFHPVNHYQLSVVAPSGLRV